MSAQAKVLVIGATGRTGRLVVKALLQRGLQVRTLVRDVARAKSMLSDQATLVAGRVQDRGAVIEAVRGADAVVFTAAAFGSVDATPKDVDYLGVERVAQAAERANLRHFILLSSAGATQPEHPHNMSFQNVLRWKLRGEDAVRAGRLPHTVVRALGLRDREGGRQGVRMVQADRIAYGEDIARADVASVLADIVCGGPLGQEETHALGFADGFDARSLINATVEIYNDTRISGGRWEASQSSLKPDPTVDKASVN